MLNFLRNLFKTKEQPTWQELSEAYNAKPVYNPLNDPEVMLPKDDINEYFVRHIVPFTQKLKPGQTVDITWDYKPGVMNQDMIAEVLGNCQCTAKIGFGKSGVKATFTHQEKNVPEGGKVYNKHVTVYFKDGTTKKATANGVLQWPPETKRVDLHFTGMLLP